MAQIFDKLVSSALQVLDLRHSEVIVNVATFEAGLVDMQGQILNFEEQREAILEMQEDLDVSSSNIGH